MKEFKRIAALCMAILTLAMPFFAAGCRYAASAEESGAAVYKSTPELGFWHAEVKLSSLSDVLPFWARLLIATAGGNTAFEVDVGFHADGTFTYETNSEKMKDCFSASAGTLIGLFLKDVDLSLYVDRVVEAVLPETVMGRERDCFGVYEREEDGTLSVRTSGGETLTFRIYGKTLVQLDREGEPALKLSKK